MGEPVRAARIEEDPPYPAAARAWREGPVAFADPARSARERAEAEAALAELMARECHRAAPLPAAVSRRAAWRMALLVVALAASGAWWAASRAPRVAPAAPMAASPGGDYAVRWRHAVRGWWRRLEPFRLVTSPALSAPGVPPAPSRASAQAASARVSGSAWWWRALVATAKTVAWIEAPR